ncbi:MAG: histidinol-phosphate transaminase [Elusimicrobiota bacterium]
MKIPEPRKNVKNFSPYIPGKSIEEVKEEQDIENVVKLASNENAWGVSPKAVEAVKKEVDKVNLYPRSVNTSLNEKIAQKAEVSPDSVITGNGTDELIELLAKTFLSAEDKDNIVISENSFARYKMAAKLMDTEIKRIKQKNFHIDIRGLYKAIDSNTKLVFIDNPCNPTGTILKKDELEYFLEKIGRQNNPPLVVLDEAYYEYVDDKHYETGLNFLDGKCPLIVLRTFSKVYGLAGLRIGYGISDVRIIDLINRIRPPFNTNRLAQVGALGAIEDDSFVNKTVKRTREEKEFMYNELDELGVEYIPSQTNFVLIKVGQKTDRKICQEALKKGIILRPLGGYKLEGYIRVTIGKRKFNKVLIEELKKYI